MKVQTEVKARGPVDDKLAELKTELDGITETVPAIDALVTGLLDALEGAKDDPEQVQALIDQARADREALVAVALKGTPAEPPPES